MVLSSILPFLVLKEMICHALALTLIRDPGQARIPLVVRAVGEDISLRSG